MVKPLNAATLVGMLILVELPPNDKVEEDEVVRLLAVPAMAGPFKVSVFAPTVSAPLVSVKAPLTVVDALNDTPAELLMVNVPNIANWLPRTCAPAVPL